MACAVPASGAGEAVVLATRHGRRRPVAAKVTGRAPARVEVDPPDVETKLVLLVRAAAPLRRALASLAGRMEALRGWERIGWARRSDYAAERLGVWGRQLLELAHMDRSLTGLPAVERAFLAGDIS